MKKFPVTAPNGEEYEVTADEYNRMCAGYYEVSLYQYSKVKNIFGKTVNKRYFLTSNVIDGRDTSLILAVETLIRQYEDFLRCKKYEENNTKTFEKWDGKIENYGKK